jgi:integrase
MTRPRLAQDGLPHRVYERIGINTYSIGYKSQDGTWAFRLKCPIKEKQAISRLRRDAIRRSLAMSAEAGEITTVGQLVDDWLKFQGELPAKSTRKRAQSTIDENVREARNLRDVFGELAIVDIKPHHAYSYLDKCDTLGRGQKGNKEIALLSVCMQRAVRLGIIDTNPVREVDKLPTTPSSRYVEDEELQLALTVGRQRGGSAHLAALALHVAYLCVRRSTEALDLRYADISDDGIGWIGKKRQAADFKRAVLIKWSPELRAAIDEARAVRGQLDGSPAEFVFGTENDTRYTRGGWKKTLWRLMSACEEHAATHGIPFKKFNLQDQRPKGVTDKMAAGHIDVQDATLHKDKKMIDAVYDRRRVRVAQPTK